MISVASLWQALLTAVSLLSIFPVPKGWLQRFDDQQVQGYSILFYPLVGLLIGLVLAAATFFFLVFSPMLSSALLVTIWVVLTGGLHIDGLADSADAWLGGHGDRQKTLKIMKDTQIGMAGVVAIVLLLIIKILALNEIDQAFILAMLFTPVLSRTMVVVLLLTTPYVREDGMASTMIQAIPKAIAWPVVGFVIVLASLFLQWHAIFIIGSCILAFFLYRIMLMHRLAGTTGDTAGALIEIIELVILLDFAAIEFLS